MALVGDALLLVDVDFSTTSSFEAHRVKAAAERVSVTPQHASARRVP
jgi:hypothetical protein